MKEIKCASWKEFESELTKLQKEYDDRRKSSSLHISNFLFRGQSNAEWPLATTLERYTPSITNVVDYYTATQRTKPELESFTGNQWETPTIDEYQQFVKKNRLNLFDPSTYRFLVYLRHYGFPSPLLDWSQSLYIAAFFAFNHAFRSENVAIYTYLEYNDHAKTIIGGSPFISVRGPHIQAPKRHFLQQSQYTTCAASVDGKLHYTSYENIVNSKNREHDLLWKFILPSSERTSVLQLLDRYNLNAYSLLGSEESLMETLAFRTLN